jgi:hypothetical protein
MPICETSESWFRFCTATTFLTIGFLKSSVDCLALAFPPAALLAVDFPTAAGFLAGAATDDELGVEIVDLPEVVPDAAPADPVDCPPKPVVGTPEPVEFPDGMTPEGSAELSGAGLPFFFDAFFFSADVLDLLTADLASVVLELPAAASTAAVAGTTPSSAFEAEFPELDLSFADKTRACWRLTQNAKTASNVKAVGARQRKPAIEFLPTFRIKCP